MEYQFKLLGKKCAATGEDLLPGSVCHSVLVEDNGELTRLDYSEQGWKGPPPGTVGTWKSVVPKVVEVKHKPLDANALLTCFEQLVEADNPGQEKLRYILGLLLVQKRRLRLETSRQEGDAQYLQLSGSNGEGAYEVRDMQLTDQEMHALQEELNAYLAAEWA